MPLSSGFVAEYQDTETLATTPGVALIVAGILNTVDVVKGTITAPTTGHHTGVGLSICDLRSDARRYQRRWPCATARGPSFARQPTVLGAQIGLHLAPSTGCGRRRSGRKPRPYRCAPAPRSRWCRCRSRARPCARTGQSRPRAAIGRTSARCLKQRVERCSFEGVPKGLVMLGRVDLGQPHSEGLRRLATCVVAGGQGVAVGDAHDEAEQGGGDGHRGERSTAPGGTRTTARQTIELSMVGFMVGTKSKRGAEPRVC